MLLHTKGWWWWSMNHSNQCVTMVTNHFLFTLTSKDCQLNLLWPSRCRVTGVVWAWGRGRSHFTSDKTNYLSTRIHVMHRNMGKGMWIFTIADWNIFILYLVLPVLTLVKLAIYLMLYTLYGRMIIINKCAWREKYTIQQLPKFLLLWYPLPLITITVILPPVLLLSCEWSHVSQCQQLQLIITIRKCQL